jgi:hypothetical protein
MVLYSFVLFASKSLQKKGGNQMTIQKQSNIWLTSAAVFALFMTPTIVAGQEFSDLQSNGNLHLRGYGSFYVQGSPKTITGTEAAGGFPWYGFNIDGGQVMAGQMYVQYLLPQAQQGKKHHPIVFTHGGILSAKSRQTTPDGRMGWDEYFARQNFDTYLVDQVSRARSGFDATQFNLVRAGLQTPSTQPSILYIPDTLMETGFRWWTNGCTVSPCWATSTPQPGLQFPIQTAGYGNGGSNLQALDFGTPDLNTTLPDFPDNGLPINPGASFSTPNQLAALSSKLGGAILVGHSESGPYPTIAALQPAAGCYPWTSASACKVKGIIQIEIGCFSNLTPAEITTLSHIPMLIVIGHFVAPALPATCNTEISQIIAAGGDIKLAWLPQLTPGSLYKGSPGPITGNDHMIMLDNNNLQIADILIGWATSRGL